MRSLYFSLFSFILTAVACAEKPNFVVIFTDDQGYQDLGCFGSPKINTPRIDRMAEEGMRLTSFYVGAPVCSASRASLLTGRNISRHGVGGAFMPETGGLPSDELTIAEVLKGAGYATACYGKWHLGDYGDMLPQDQGFDEYFGIPFSNDMYIGPTHKIAENAVFTIGYDQNRTKADQAKVAEMMARQAKFGEYRQAGLTDYVPIFEGREIVEYPAKQDDLTERYFDRAIAFMEKNKEENFFVYLTPAMPHVPLFATERFAGKSERGPYGDTLEELDFHTGRLLDYLEENGLAESTFVIYTSDNGPWLPKGDAGGSALPLKNGKHSGYEGGVRVPTVMWWPGTIKAGRESDEMLSTLDFMVTFAEYAGAELPEDLAHDGFDFSDHIENSDTRFTRNVRIYHMRGNCAPYGVRKGDWKYLRKGGKNYDLGPELYNLAEDVSESVNLVEKYPQVAKELDGVVEAYIEGL
ncbi:MAG: sulfatase [Verrucomicrobiota bacterium]